VVVVGGLLKDVGGVEMVGSSYINLAHRPADASRLKTEVIATSAQ